MNHLRRDLAPISDTAWSAIDEEAQRSLRSFLAARRLVTFEGPSGWDATGVATGHTTAVEPPVDGVEAAARNVRPMIELRTRFTLAREQLDAVDRGARDPDLQPVTEAARRAALAEDGLVFGGLPGAGIEGIASACPYEPIMIGDDYRNFPTWVARAVALLR